MSQNKITKYLVVGAGGRTGATVPKPPPFRERVHEVSEGDVAHGAATSMTPPQYVPTGSRSQTMSEQRRRFEAFVAENRAAFGAGSK